LPKFHFEKFVNSQREKIFEIFTSYTSFQKLIPEHFPSVRVLSTRNEVSVVEEHLVLGERELVMMTKHVVEEPARHDIFVIGGDAKGTHITEIFKQRSNGTKLEIDVDFKIKGSMKLSALFGKNKIENDYLRIVEKFVKIAEI
jgi:coenzyme Q-binding protein COQ10